jgi:hypothetical protein
VSLKLMGWADARLFLRGSIAHSPGHWTLYGGSVSGRCSVEWVLGQGFSNTEAEGGPLWATEKNVALSGEASQAIFQTKRVDVEQ